MNTLANLSLGFAAFIYLLPMQWALQQPHYTGHRGLGTMLALLSTSLLFWLSLFVAWCVLVAQGGFAWVGGTRPLQFLAMLVTCIALGGVTTLSVALRGDSELPTTLRPLMPWAKYVFPALVLVATALLLNASASTRPQVLAAGRFTLGLCSAIALVSAAGIAAQYVVLRKRDMARVARHQPAAREKAIRHAIAEVESLDLIKDFDCLLRHAGPDRFHEAQEAACRKIAAHPHLNQALAKQLRSPQPQNALSYLRVNTPPDLTALKEPVGDAILTLATCVQQKIASEESISCSYLFDEAASALEVADKFPESGPEFQATIRELRAAFNRPKTAAVNLSVIYLLDDWLSRQPTAENNAVSIATLSQAH